MTQHGELRILFVATALNYPIFQRRLEAFRRLGANVIVLGFDQDFAYSSRPAMDSTAPSRAGRLGVITSGRYGRRAIQLATVVPTLRSALASVDVVYAMGFDAAVLVRSSALGLGRTTIAYEIHDIRQVMLRHDWTGLAMRAIERWVLRGVQLLVVTAEGYLTHYYRAKLGLAGVETIVVENKLPKSEGSRSVTQARVKPPLRIGYFGSLRCTEAWRTLTRVAAVADGGVEVEIRGVPEGLESFYHDIQADPRLTFGGPYKDPDDLAEIYGGVHLVWAAGFHGRDSYVWSRSCRFYAACCYQRPIVAQIGTDEGALVERLGIGLCVDIRNADATAARILRITSAELQRWQHNLAGLPDRLFIYADEHRLVLDRLASISENR